MSITDNAVVILEDASGQKFRASMSQAQTLALLEQSRAGGISTVIGYKSQSGYVKGKGPTADLQVLTRFNTANLYRRKIAALANISYNDAKALLKKDAKLAALEETTLIQEFEARKLTEIASLNKSLTDSDRSDAHRAAHDRCYGKTAAGIRVHFETETVNGIKVPILTDNLPTVDSIMLDVLELNKVITVEGERLPPANSGIPVRISNVLKKLLNSRSVQFKALSLKPDNFERIRMDRVDYLPEDVSRIGEDVLNG